MIDTTLTQPGAVQRTEPRDRRNEVWADEDRQVVIDNPETPARDLAIALGRTEAAINTLRHQMATVTEREDLLTRRATRTNSRWTQKDWAIARDATIDDLDAAAILSRTPMAIRTRRSEIRNGKFPIETLPPAEPVTPKPSIADLFRQLADAFEGRGL